MGKAGWEGGRCLAQVAQVDDSSRLCTPLSTPELLGAGKGAQMLLLILRLCESDGGVS